MVLDSATWSPSGRSFSFVRADEFGSPHSLWTYEIGAAEAEEVRADGLHPPFVKSNHAIPAKRSFQVHWLDEDKLLYYGGAADRQSILSDYLASRPDYTKPDVSRFDWFVLEPAAPPRPVTSAVPSPSPAIWDFDSSSMTVMSEGRCWKVNLRTGEAHDQFPSILGKITGYLTSARDMSSGANWKTSVSPSRRAILSVRAGTTGLSHYVVDFVSSSSRRISITDLGVRDISARTTGPMRLSVDGQKLAFVASSDAGYKLRVVDLRTGGNQTIHELSSFLSDRKPGSARSFSYVSLKGAPLSGWLLLPPQHDPAKQYPMVVNVYAGSIMDPERVPDDFALWREGVTSNLQLLAAQGFIVMRPSMPLGPMGEPEHMYDRLLEGVMPAVDKVVELGLADPDRLAVMGCSGGGYSTMGIVSQTDRFKAAIAVSGEYDLTSVYGEFTNNRRYHRWPLEEVGRSADVETGFARLGTPPWASPQLARQNSPLSHIQKIETPVLLLHSDLDEIHVQQAELVFTGLYRLGKRARLVRYFGDDGHCSPQSPANRRHMFSQIMRWLTEHLKTTATPATAR